MHPSSRECLPTGWDPLDREHADILRSLAALGTAVDASDVARARSAAQDVLRMAAAHFAHEERLMRENAYSRLARHKEAHDLYLAEVASFARHVAEEGVTPEFRRWSAGRAVAWFRFHVSANDVALGAFLAGKRRAQPPKP